MLFLLGPPLRDGIQIDLVSDWYNYRTRLIYAQPQALAALKAEQRSAARTEDSEAEPVSFY